MTWVLAGHLVVMAAALVAGRRMGRRVLLLAAIAPFSALVWAVRVAPEVLGSGAVTTSVSWVPDLGLDLAIRVDGFSLLMVMLVAALGVAVFVYAASYFEPRNDLGGFSAVLVGFAAAMLGLVTVDNLLALYVFWELTSITSYLLIGFENRSAAARSAALKALLVTGTGSLMMLAGVVLVAQLGSGYSLQAILSQPPEGARMATGMGLILVGAFTKSAQVPFHFWLPAAMAAPTPVSAYLHSATMVTAGVYLIARLAPVFASLVEFWRPVVMVVGAATMILGGWRALSQSDLKLLLAMGTVSQLGFMTVLVGYGHPALTTAGVAVILAHAVFKGALFMVVGILDHHLGSRDQRKLAGWGRVLPLTWWVAVISVASMVGIPPLVGFVAKEQGLSALLEVSGAGWATLAVVAGSALTLAYGLHFLSGSRSPAKPDTVVVRSRRPSAWFIAPAAALAVVTVAAGIWPGVIDGLVAAAATSVDPAAQRIHLALWHGFTPALGLSAVALAVGVLVWRSPLGPVRRLTGRAPDSHDLYRYALRSLNWVSDRTTSIVQSGSLPIYLQIILASAILLPGFLLVRYWEPGVGVPLVDSVLRLVVVAVILVGAAGVVRARRRLGAVLFLGAIGYGVALVFVLHGAPDLALTQLLIETLTLAMFVMVLRHLPERWETVTFRAGQVSRVVISVAMGLATAIFSLWAVSGRVARPISEEYLELARVEGGGRNVVNVILTDFRAFDTLGEISVLAVAAAGVAVLVGRVRSRSSEEES